MKKELKNYCAFCDEVMQDYESNNPDPFIFESGYDRVCRDCDNFVSATRMLCTTEEQVSFIQNLLMMSFSLKKARKKSMEIFEEMNKQKEE